MAKTTPWLLASRDYNIPKNHTLPGWTAQPTLTTFHHRAVRCKISVQDNDIQRASKSLAAHPCKHSTAAKHMRFAYPGH